jgi:hypothetical protein
MEKVGSLPYFLEVLWRVFTIAALGFRPVRLEDSVVSKRGSIDGGLDTQEWRRLGRVRCCQCKLIPRRVGINNN